MTQKSHANLSALIGEELPYLRRYARALTGSQDDGDKYAIAALETIVADPDSLDQSRSVKVGLFAVFHRIWASSGAPLVDGGDGYSTLEQRAHWRMSELRPNTREALLLRTIEGFSADAAAEIMQVSQDEIDQLYQAALDDLETMVSGDILIIEDEGIIAMDLKAIVTDMGHRVSAIARTRGEAVIKGTAARPDLILADIQLADKSSGIDAVADLLSELGDVPVIFITAFPERLLTGERPEPAFMISKPYAEEQVRAAVSQAMFFATTEDMDVAV